MCLDVLVKDKDTIDRIKYFAERDDLWSLSPISSKGYLQSFVKKEPYIFTRDKNGSCTGILKTAPADTLPITFETDSYPAGYHRYVGASALGNYKWLWWTLLNSMSKTLQNALLEDISLICRWQVLAKRDILAVGLEGTNFVVVLKQCRLLGIYAPYWCLENDWPDMPSIVLRQIGLLIVEVQWCYEPLSKKECRVKIESEFAGYRIQRKKLKSLNLWELYDPELSNV